MTLAHILPILAYLAAALFLVSYTIHGKETKPGTWIVPAALSAAFAAFTLVQIAQDGVLMFWTNHTQNLTGNQVWFDLLMSVCLAWVLLLPEARRLGLAVIPWLIFVLLTASIGLFAMLARVMYLQAKAAEGVPNNA